MSYRRPCGRLGPSPGEGRDPGSPLSSPTAWTRGRRSRSSARISGLAMPMPGKLSPTLGRRFSEIGMYVTTELHAVPTSSVTCFFPSLTCFPRLSHTFLVSHFSLSLSLSLSLRPSTSSSLLMRSRNLPGSRAKSVCPPTRMPSSSLKRRRLIS